MFAERGIKFFIELLHFITLAPHSHFIDVSAAGVMLFSPHTHTIDQAGNRAFPLVTLHLHELDDHRIQCFPRQKFRYARAAINSLTRSA
jgi:hypothetical protein